MSTVNSTHALETARCLGCGEEIQFEPSLHGRVVNCPACDCLTRLVPESLANPPVAPTSSALQILPAPINPSPAASAPIHAVGSVKKTKCLHCGLPMSFDSQDAGRRIKCPSCANPVTLPGGAAMSFMPPPLPQQHPLAPLLPQMGYAQPLPTSVAVEMAETEIESRREDLVQRRQRLDWQRDDRDLTAVVGLGVNATTLAFVLSAIVFHQNARGYAVAVLSLSVLAALAGCCCSFAGAFLKSNTQRAGQIGIFLGFVLIFLIPAGWSILK
jgi:DNA-directed RNA polymerase subunit RPC12/RpoP